jgi:hypothetical protein|tara:strand:+ start:5213 stop:5410 length:198 start_codon:yes stop_codon:yes gene_type:complete
MAKLNEEVIVIKISEMLKDTDPVKPLLPPEMLTTLEPVIGELTGRQNVMVEVISETNVSEVQQNV